METGTKACTPINDKVSKFADEIYAQLQNNFDVFEQNEVLKSVRNALINSRDNEIGEKGKRLDDLKKSLETI